MSDVIKIPFFIYLFNDINTASTLFFVVEVTKPIFNLFFLQYLITSITPARGFNLAFKISGLKWHWSKKLYQSMLKKSGGEKRVKKFSLEKKTLVNAKKN